jgi:hypothetical protein
LSLNGVTMAVSNLPSSFIPGGLLSV